jgi:hypothetical protein
MQKYMFFSEKPSQSIFLIHILVDLVAFIQKIMYFCSRKNAKLRVLDKVTNRIGNWWRQLDERQRQSTRHTVLTDEQHTCANCGTAFVGRFCPQCGLQANRHRMTAKNVAQGFLDIWGMGSQPMLRSIKELFWRPGYMMRDYLNGHQPLYFPPFKMLVIITLFFALVCSLRGIEPNADDAFVYGDVFQRYGDTPWVISLFAKIDQILIWLHTHPAYQAIVAGIFYILASWMVFLRRMLFFEVFFSQLYISCQMQIVGAAWVLLTGSEAYYNLPPFAVPLLIGVPLLCYDYAQLYGLRLWPALWRTVLTFVLTILLMILLGTAPIILVKLL